MRKIDAVKYLIGATFIIACITSQYIFNVRDFLHQIILVYVIPSTIILFLDGKRIISNSYKNMRIAVKYGLGYFGIFSATGFGLAFILIVTIFALDPSSQQIINRPNPLLNISPDFAWYMIFFSFIIVGPFEEFIFRGFMFGALKDILEKFHWTYSALISSFIFTIIHFYYYIIFGNIALIQFTQLFMFSIGMCGAYYKSGGNLIIPALLHGAFDATSFLMIAIPNFLIGLNLKILLILVGIFVGIFYVVGKK
ncbi:MAG: CPBP family intramembrane metalloprotease [Nitrososphaeria archaeon]|nr:CPBP family intramembrane metalloprotease [Nitrososphaeria archaeon]